MNEKKEKNDGLSSIWFMARWLTGYIIDIGLAFGAVSVSLMSLLIIPVISNMLITQGYTASGNIMVHPLTQIISVLAIFSAVMAGRNWARSMYYTHILPEVWENTIRDIIAKAQKEHGDKNE